MADKLVTEGRWVVGTDGSERAEKAVEWAARHVSERTVPVPLLIVHAIPETPIPTRNAAATSGGAVTTRRCSGRPGGSSPTWPSGFASSTPT